MKSAISEHRFYSFTPRPTAQAAAQSRDGVAKGEHAADRAADGAQSPTAQPSAKKRSGWSRKNPKKLLKKFWPCRKYGIHIAHPVLLFCLIKTSAGRYVFDKMSLHLVA